MTFLKPMADGPSFLYKKLVQEIGPCVISSRTSFFSYEKLGRIRTLLYSVRETWSHVIEMLRRYWLEVRFAFVSHHHMEKTDAGLVASESEK